jgi:heme oxygenase
MSLKDLTAEKHKLAESTPFMKAVFAKTLPREMWIDWTYQKALFYHALEGIAGSRLLLSDLPDVRRGYKLWQDYQQMLNGTPSIHTHKKSVLAYHSYLMSLTNTNDIMAHLYTWHMGDLYGGQMIKKIVLAPHSSLDFASPAILMNNMRAKLDDRMGAEANRAFDWAIRMMREYDSSLEQDTTVS